MKFLIGTDEAGYGPNLGPLVITATVWKVPQNCQHEDILQLSRRMHEANRQIRLGDSKEVYQSANKSLYHLEKTTLVLLGKAGIKPSDYRALLSAVIHGNDFHPASLKSDDSNRFFFDAKPAGFPQECTAEEIDQACQTVFQNTDLPIPVDIRSCILTPANFNQQLIQHENKATVLSANTLELIRKVLPPSEHPVEICCDKHGGRSKYAPLINHHLDDQFVEILEESREESRYRFHKRPWTARFVAKGERLFPIAAASMVSKYIRELMMQRWNRFWQKHIPELKPTAGYPVDARRFKQEIAALQQQLRIEDSEIWRER